MTAATAEAISEVPGCSSLLSPLEGKQFLPRWIARTENLAVTIALFLMMLLPLAESIVRRFQGSITGAARMEQHLTLIVSMIGGAIAAREARLLSMSTLQTLLSERWKTALQVFANGYAAIVTVFLGYAASQFVLSEKEAGQVIAYGIHAWTIQLLLPLGFAVISLRVIWNGSGWLKRTLTFGVASAFMLLLLNPPASPQELIIPGAIVVVIAAAAGAPIYSILGGAALLLFWSADVTIAAISIDHYSLVTNPTLPTVPLFTLAGFFLAEGGASRRLLRVFQAYVGHTRGGSAILTTLVCAFFTSFTGASGVTILALGGLLFPVLLHAKYSEKTALGLLTATGSIGLLFPPCLPLIFYAIIAQVSIEGMFLGGLIPGVLLVLMIAGWGVYVSPPVRNDGRFTTKEAVSATWAAKWELLLPVVAFVALFGGFATPVEAAAITALYAFVIETFIYRDLNIFRDSTRVMAQCGLLVGGVLLILGVALGFTNYLVDAEVPTQAASWITANVHSRWVFLLLLNMFLIVVGALMDIYSAIVIVVPLMVPIGAAFGINPIHLGIIFLANAELGFLMPPVGENLFLSSYRFNKPVTEVFKAVVPLVIVYLVGVLLITYVPAMTLSLPRWFGR